MSENRERFEWAVAGVVVAAGGIACLAAATFFAVPMVDYAWTWWKVLFW